MPLGRNTVCERYQTLLRRLLNPEPRLQWGRASPQMQPYTCRPGAQANQGTTHKPAGGARSGPRGVNGEETGPSKKATGALVARQKRNDTPKGEGVPHPKGPDDLQRDTVNRQNVLIPLPVSSFSKPYNSEGERPYFVTKVELLTAPMETHRLSKEPFYPCDSHGLRRS